MVGVALQASSLIVQDESFLLTGVRSDCTCRVYTLLRVSAFLAYLRVEK